MTVELTMLVSSALLSLALALLTIAIHLRSFGGATIRGSREVYPALAGAARRVVRAHSNLNEALLPFAIVVVAAALLHVSTSTTASAAALFFGARIAHASLYVAGVPVLRSVAYYVGFGATMVIAVQMAR